MSRSGVPQYYYQYMPPHEYGHPGWYTYPVYSPPVPNSAATRSRPPTKCPCAHYKREHKITYAALIAAAIVSSPEKELRMEQIYDFIQRHNLLLDLQDHLNWKNSVRHNLSLRKCFIKVPRNAADGHRLKSLWRVDDTCLPAAAEELLTILKEQPKSIHEKLKAYWLSGELETPKTSSRPSSVSALAANRPQVAAVHGPHSSPYAICGANPQHLARMLPPTASPYAVHHYMSSNVPLTAAGPNQAKPPGITAAPMRPPIAPYSMERDSLQCPRNGPYGYPVGGAHDRLSPIARSGTATGGVLPMAGYAAVPPHSGGDMHYPYPAHPGMYAPWMHAIYPASHPPGWGPPAYAGQSSVLGHAHHTAGYGVEYTSGNHPPPDTVHYPAWASAIASRRQEAERDADDEDNKAVVMETKKRKSTCFSATTAAPLSKKRPDTAAVVIQTPQDSRSPKSLSARHEVSPQESTCTSTHTTLHITSLEPTSSIAKDAEKLEANESSRIKGDTIVIIDDVQ
eukprot:m.404467 g.404467  ORF g.404467 m.404467 type:complete len:511 (+) comp21197_c1_seq4:323-1855(+)